MDDKEGSVSKCHDLDVIFDGKLGFNMRIAKVITESYPSLGFLKHNSVYLDLDPKIVIYNLVRPKLEYVSIVWNSSSAWCIDEVKKM